ncbi:MAG: toprim domain-containing protein [Thermodesulfovibrionales bacterium]
MQRKSVKHNSEDRDLERAARIREVLAALAEVNRRFPVIVEGRNDARALGKLGLEGEMLILHRGQGVYEFCEDVAEQFPRVVLLMDWDLKGESLQGTLAQYLSGHWEEFSLFRDFLKMLCQKDVKDIEGIPRLLERLESGEPSR